MRIKEALERGPMERPRTSYAPEFSLEEGVVLGKANRLLEESHVLEALGELVADLPDAQISRVKMLPDGSVSTSLQWDFRKSSERSSPLEPEYNRLNIRVFLPAEEIAIGGEILKREQWADRAIVEDAVTEAFRNPEKWIGSNQKSQIRIIS